MPLSTLFRFTAADGLARLIAPDSTRATLHVDAVHSNHAINGQNPTPCTTAVAKDLRAFDQLVCDFDETITDHDTTACFDSLASQVRHAHFADPQLTWPQILQAYLDDLDKVNVSDLCHLHDNDQNVTSSSHPAAPVDSRDSGGKPNQIEHPQPPLDPKLRELNCQRVFTPEPELPALKLPSLQPWIHSQMRKRAVEKASLNRVFESGNLVGMTRAQIRDYGRNHVRLRPGMVQLLKAFAQEQDRREQEMKDHGSTSTSTSTEQQQQQQRHRQGELWVVSVNWSEDLIRGAMDQIFGSEEATERYLPPSNLTCSSLEFNEEGHEMLKRRMKPNVGVSGSKDTEDSGSVRSEHLSNGEIKTRCLTGTDKLHAFQKIQRDYAAKHNIAMEDTKWAYLGDSATDLGCLVKRAG
ncbi:hypothetical protein B0O80DRAFT_420809 [Mortierella sp. GBAus27b]|nr:hypothetical protein B0O80DRAFT_420809 [Mortierella sp. GBAus27b]